MLLDRGNYPWVNCAVDISKNPDLLQAKEGKRYWVQGKIISVSMGTIELGDVALYPA